MIATCTNCGNKPHSQDELNGKGKRVFNYAKALNGKNGGFRCTRCGHTLEGHVVEVKDAEKTK